MAIIVTVPPAVEPFTTEEVKQHLRITHNDEDGYINTLITVARQKVENEVHRALITQTIVATFDEFPDGYLIELERPPLITVTSLKYKQSSDGVLTTLVASNYDVDVASSPGRIVLKSGFSWPSLFYGSPNGVEVTYTAGYGTSADKIPSDLKHAMLYLIGQWFKNREPVDSFSQNIVPYSLDYLLGPYKVY